MSAALLRPTSSARLIARWLDRRAQCRPCAILGRSMRRRSHCLRCLRGRRGRRPLDHHDGAGPLVCPVDAVRSSEATAGAAGVVAEAAGPAHRPGSGRRQGRPRTLLARTAADAKIEWRVASPFDPILGRMSWFTGGAPQMSSCHATVAHDKKSAASELLMNRHQAHQKRRQTNV